MVVNHWDTLLNFQFLKDCQIDNNVSDKFLSWKFDQSFAKINHGHKTFFKVLRAKNLEAFTMTNESENCNRMKRKPDKILAPKNNSSERNE